MFTEIVKERRIALELSLREFGRLVEEDPSNWSKVERGLLAPPQDEAKLARIAEVLELSRTSISFEEFKDAAVLASGRIPDDLMEDAELLQRLPAFLRIIRNVRPTAEELNGLIERIRAERA